MSSLQELRQVLKEDASGRNLYDHLTEVLMKLLIERPANAFDNFELISADTKLNPLNPDPEKGRPLPPSGAEVCMHGRMLARLADSLCCATISIFSTFSLVVVFLIYCYFDDFSSNAIIFSI